MGENKTYRGSSAFYPFYFVGTTLGLLAALHAFSTLNFWWLAWIGHFFFEKNRRATCAHRV